MRPYIRRQVSCQGKLELTRFVAASAFGRKEFLDSYLNEVHSALLLYALRAARQNALACKSYRLHEGENFPTTSEPLQGSR